MRKRFWFRLGGALALAFAQIAQDQEPGLQYCIINLNLFIELRSPPNPLGFAGSR
jgi:hypothetical protein